MRWERDDASGIPTSPNLSAPRGGEGFDRHRYYEDPIDQEAEEAG